MLFGCTYARCEVPRVFQTSFASFPVQCHNFDVRRPVATCGNFTLTMSMLSGVALILITKYPVLMVLSCARQRECDWA
ncbi:hypothetical protein HZH66_001054 [Vespula vulgaris]|uniref:Uncharacterized protein n=1 Tax=Vespula vulgaris TaxID=7454 RepID=A0A834NLI4_VESVU|nr:hypothetical protein HZH66_001054 [Vespula vulgaris]